MPSVEKGRYEMLWDCPGCGTPKLLGLTHRHCPNCGAPQDPTRRYFPEESEAVAVEDHPYQGVDVTCAACDTPNAAKSTFCVGCGSPLDGAKAVGTRAERGMGGSDSATEAAREAEAARQRARQEAQALHAHASGHAPPPKRSWWKALVAVGCLGFAGLAVVAVAVFFLWKREATVVVSGHAWERTIAVETYGPTRDSAWRDQVPAGAYQLSCSRAQRDTRKIPDGETCVDKRRDKGDGTYAVVQECTPRYREEPVYDDKCSYTVDRWQVSSTERAGAPGLTPAPSWPAVRLSRTGTCVGCQREGARTETYTVRFQEGDETHACELPEAKWRAMAVGSRWASEVGVVSGSLDCDALTAR